MIIIVGLGNPGEKFENTRHNVGFMAINAFAKKNDFPEFELDKKSNCLLSKKNSVFLIKPQTFMNNSGKSVKPIALQYKVKSNNVLVIHDDSDLPLGSIKIVKERGSAGHKGVESVMRTIGKKGLMRLRIGIRPTIKHKDSMDLVLKKFSPKDQDIISKILKKTSFALDLLINEGLDKAMNEYNR